MRCSTLRGWECVEICFKGRLHERPRFAQHRTNLNPIPVSDMIKGRVDSETFR